MAVRFRVRVPSPAAGAGPVDRVVDIDVDVDIGVGVGAAVGPGEIRIGRGTDLELPLPFDGLSVAHARVWRAHAGEGGTWLVEDLGSETGTTLDGARLVPGTPRALVPGATLQLGRVAVLVVFEGEVAGDSPPDSAGVRREGTATIARRLVTDLFAAIPSGAVPELEVIVGPEPGQRLALADPGRPYLAGRGAGCALPLVVDEISREHAVFVWTPEGVVVRDLGSKNGVRVAGERVASEQRVPHGALIDIGPVILRLRDPVDRYLADLAAAAASPSPPTGPSPPAGPSLPAGPEPRTRRSGYAMATVAVAVLVAVAAAAIALLAG